jgi:hypothetical protein
MMLLSSANLIYHNPLSSPSDVNDFRLEGEAGVTFEDGKMRLQNRLDPSLGQQSNFVFWCPVTFPSSIAVSWEFQPLSEQGLAMLFFAASGRQGADLFAPELSVRRGEYSHYHSGDINTLHLSYYRRRYEEERAFHTCNLRKSKGAHLVCQGADPIPYARDVLEPYRMLLVKRHQDVEFYINELLILRWSDDGKAHGRVLGPGKLGFRQMAPLVAEYKDLKVFDIKS